MRQAMRLFEITKSEGKVLLTLCAETGACATFTYETTRDALTIARRFLTNPGTDLNFDPRGSGFVWACATGGRADV